MSRAQHVRQPTGHSARVNNEAFREGYDTFWRGAPLSANPYETEAKEYVLWDRGWLQAELETYDE